MPKILSISMTQIFIPRYRLVDEPPEKPHYVYVVEVLEGGVHHRVERRYSAFHCLHREVMQILSKILSIVKVDDVALVYQYQSVFFLA
jgi:hypothetical protein